MESPEPMDDNLTLNFRTEVYSYVEPASVFHAARIETEVLKLASTKP